ncbi:nicotinate phosphoribosyltransferase [Luteococcus sanguinis]|uniref:Nicotinate phosphoribosyltransferase n=1 Tax=Luteococcus sanguinis TaxID=174038 RepID=A0ABW1X1K5_9ACTN
MTTALLTDHYELTMVRAAMGSGTAFRRSVFELFPRRLPEGRRYGVVAGVGRMLDAIEDFTFDEETVTYLAERSIANDELAAWLRDFRFTGQMWGYPEGEIYFPGSPLLRVEGNFAECCVMETLLLSIYNHDCAMASAASRMTAMAEGRPCIEMGARRAHEWAAVAAARAAYVAGFATTSNLQAGRSWGVPTTGTAAHSFTLLHDSEEGAFQAQINAFGPGTTLLVDTYDLEEAVRTGVRLTEGKLGAIRLDSGEHAIVARQMRDLLDDLGAEDTKIIVTSDLDEYQIAALRGAPVDGYGVGTSVVTGSGHPTCGFVYKLVARADSDAADAELKPVAKKSLNKNTVGGRKFAMRRLDEQGVAKAEIVGIGNPPSGDGNDRQLMVELVRDGQVVGREELSVGRERHERARAELPVAALRVSKGDPAIPTIILEPDGDEAYNPYLHSIAPTNI